MSSRLTKDYGKGLLVRNLEYCRNFYLEYPFLLALKKRLSENKLDPEEREEIERLFQDLEIKLKM